MTGLLLKDLYVLRRTAKIYLAMMAFYMVLTVAGTFDNSMVIGFVCLFCMMLPVSSFAYDEAARWDKYAAAFPTGRRGIVAAKYLLVLCTGGLGLALTVIMGLLLRFMKSGDMGEMLLTGAVCVSVGLFMNSILLPMLFKLGAERGRVLMMAVYGGIFLLVVAGARFLGENGRFAAPPLGSVAAGLAVVTAAAAVISYRLSLSIFEKKEL